MSERVVMLGASNNPHRAAFEAIEALTHHGHEVVPVNPRLTAIGGHPCVSELVDVKGGVDTITVYLRAELAEPLGDAMIELNPRRVIFNPGSESGALKQQLEAAGIEVQWQCTLVLLRSGQYQRKH